MTRCARLNITSQDITIICNISLKLKSCITSKESNEPDQPDYEEEYFDEGYSDNNF
jgi:hypothetical protein